jgi:hypothetical protein
MPQLSPKSKPFVPCVDEWESIYNTLNKAHIIYNTNINIHEICWQLTMANIPNTRS